MQKLSREENVVEIAEGVTQLLLEKDSINYKSHPCNVAQIQMI